MMWILKFWSFETNEWDEKIDTFENLRLFKKWMKEKRGENWRWDSKEFLKKSSNGDCNHDIRWEIKPSKVGTENGM